MSVILQEMYYKKINLYYNNGNLHTINVKI